MSYNSKLEKTNRRVANARRKYYGSFDYGSGVKMKDSGGVLSFNKYDYGGLLGRLINGEGAPIDSAGVVGAISSGAGIVNNAIANAKLDMSYSDWKSSMDRQLYDKQNSLYQATDNSGLLTALDSMRYFNNPESTTFRSNSFGKDTLSVFNSALSGALAGSTFSPIGAIVGGAAGFLTGATGVGVGRYKANQALTNSKDWVQKANNRINVSKQFAISNVDALNDLQRQREAMKYSYLNAFGGNLAHGADFSNGLDFVDVGGTHESNPYEGVLVGLDSGGVPNLVEEGEAIWDNEYVFSDRTKIPKELANKYKLGGNLTFAEAVREITKESEKRPNDPISNATNRAILAEFRDVQEQIRQTEQVRAAKEYRNALDTQFMEELAAMPQEQAPMQGMSIPQEQMQQEPYPMQDEGMMPPGYAYGGHLFSGGGNKGSDPEGLSAISTEGGVIHHWVTSDGLQFQYRTAKERDRVYQKAVQHQRELNAKALQGAESGVIVKWDNGQPYYVTSDGSHVGTLESTNEAQKRINSPSQEGTSPSVAPVEESTEQVEPQVESPKPAKKADTTAKTSTKEQPQPKTKNQQKSPADTKNYNISPEIASALLRAGYDINNVYESNGKYYDNITGEEIQPYESVPSLEFDRPDIVAQVIGGTAPQIPISAQYRAGTSSTGSLNGTANSITKTPRVSTLDVTIPETRIDDFDEDEIITSTEDGIDWEWVDKDFADNLAALTEYIAQEDRKRNVSKLNEIEAALFKAAGYNPDKIVFNPDDGTFKLNGKGPDLGTTLIKKLNGKSSREVLGLNDLQGTNKYIGKTRGTLFDSFGRTTTDAEMAQLKMAGLTTKDIFSGDDGKLYVGKRGDKDAKLLSEVAEKKYRETHAPDMRAINDIVAKYAPDLSVIEEEVKEEPLPTEASSFEISTDPAIRKYLVKKGDFKKYIGTPYTGSEPALEDEEEGGKRGFDWARLAPIIGTGLAANYGMSGSPDYSEANAILREAELLGTPINIPIETLGDYVQPKPFDERYLVNAATQARNAAYRGAMNTAGGNRAMQLGAQSYLAGAYQNNLAEIMRQAYLANREDYYKAAEFNRGTNVQNMGAINARNATQAQLNSARQQARFQGIANARGLRQSLKNDWDNNTRTSLDTFLTNLGAWGKEQQDEEFARALSGIGYSHTYDKDGHLVLNKLKPAAKGGKINRKKRRF